MVPAFAPSLLVLAAIVSSVVMSRQMPDDAYIYLRIAENVVHRGEWAFNPGVPVNAATSPLYAVFVALLVALHLPGLITSLVVASALSLGLLAVATYRGMLPFGPVAATLAALIASTFPTLLRSEGMETPTYLACIALTALAVQGGNEYIVGALAGLTALGRPEGGIIIPIALGALWLRSGRVPWRALLLPIIPIALWLGFCLHTFHTVVPHTMKIKAMQSSLPAWQESWLIGFIAHLKALRFLAPFAAFGAFLVVRDLKRSPFAAIVILFGLIQIAGYTVAHAPATYFWYDSPGDFAYLLALVVGLVAALRWIAARYTALPRSFVAWTLSAALCLWALATIAYEATHAKPYRVSPDYIASALWLKQHAGASDWIAANEIGYIGIYSGLPVKDMLGLADPDSVAALQQRHWDFWYTDKGEPRFIVVHTNPPGPGEPDSPDTPWPAATLNAYHNSYHVAFASGDVRVMQRD